MTVPTVAGRTRRKGLVVHRSRSLPEHETCVEDGIPVTTVARTLLDLSQIFDRRRLEKTLDEAEYLRLYDGIALAL